MGLVQNSYRSKELKKLYHTNSSDDHLPFLLNLSFFYAWQPCDQLFCFIMRCAVAPYLLLDSRGQWSADRWGWSSPGSRGTRGTQSWTPAAKTNNRDRPTKHSLSKFTNLSSDWRLEKKFKSMCYILFFVLKKRKEKRKKIYINIIHPFSLNQLIYVSVRAMPRAKKGQQFQN